MGQEVGSSLDGLLALGRVLKLLGGDLVEQLAQAVLDDVVCDLLVAALRARSALHRGCCQRVELRDISQHGHRLHDSMNSNEATVSARTPSTTFLCCTGPGAVNDPNHKALSSLPSADKSR